MMPTRSALVRFFHELRQRHVFRVAIAYGVVALALMELADFIVGALGLPPVLSRLVVILLLLGFPLAIALAWAFDVSPEGLVRTGPRARAESADRRIPAGPWSVGRSIAVLPFVDMSGDESNRYFSDGITEDIIARLCRVRQFKVISRTSVMAYRNRVQNLREIANELRVTHVLEGSVRRAGERVRIVAQLIDADADVHLWAETYDRDLEDIFAIQTDVAQQIVHALTKELVGHGTPTGDLVRRIAPPSRASLDGALVQRAPPVDLETYDLYLRGRHHWTLRTDAGLEQSRELLTAAVDRSPDYALAWAALADTNIALGIYTTRPPRDVMPAARVAADRALAIDGDLPEAIVARGCIRSLFDFDWTGGESDFQRAADIGPQYATGPHWYALHNLAPRGRFADAHTAFQIARELDPLAGAIQAGIAFVHYLQRQYDEARAELESILRRDPRFALAHLFLGLLLTETGETDSALDALDRARELRGDSPEITGARARTLALAGQVEAAAELADALRRERDLRYVSPTRIAQLHVAAGNPVAALDELEEAFRVRAVELIWLRHLPAFQPLHGEARFRELAHRMGL